MSDRIDLGGRPWTAIPREVLRDGRLSPAAKGGLVTLLSHDTGWVRSVIAILMKENRRCGREQARAIMRELCSVGYAELVQSRNEGGRFTTGYTVFGEARSGARTSASPGAVPPYTVQPGAVDPSAVVDPQDVDPQDVDPRVTLSTPRKRDVIADALAVAEGSDPLEVPASRMRTLCVKANELRKVAPTVTPAEVAARAARWESHFGDATVTGPAIVTHWARLRRAGPGRRRGESTLDRHARKLVEGVTDDDLRGGRRAGDDVAGELPRVAGE